MVILLMSREIYLSDNIGLSHVENSVKRHLERETQSLLLFWEDLLHN